MSVLRDQPLFAGVPDERLEGWEAKCTPRDLADGEVLFNDDVPIPGFVLLVEGTISTAAIGSTVAAPGLGEVIIAGLNANNLAFVVQGGLLTAALALIEEVLADTAATLDQRELDRARTQARAALAMQLETPWGQSSYAARQWQVHGRLVPPAEVNARLALLDVDAVRSAGARLLAGSPARATLGLPTLRAA